MKFIYSIKGGSSMSRPYYHLTVFTVLMFFLLLTGCTYLVGTSRQPIPIEPRIYVAEYGKVWNSALDVLDEEGYVIAQMDKSNGYIATERKEGERYRDKVSLRILDKGEEVTVIVNYYFEEKTTYTHLSTGATSYSWWETGSDGYFEKGIQNEIAEKLGLAE
jgi:hypothetical protein